MRNVFFLFIILCFQQHLQAQMVSDGLLFSETQPTITARSLALGNSLGAMGGDMAAASLNPAGIAVYRRMEIALSLGGLFNGTSTDFVGYGARDRISQFSFGHAGMVFAAKLRKKSTKWKTINVGITFNRLANYARNFTFQGISNGSRLQAFAANAYGSTVANLDPFEGWVAYNAYLIDSTGPASYIANGGVSDTTYTTKSQTVHRRGGVNELGFTLGANYNHKLYIAGTIGINFMSMTEDKSYQELADSMDLQAFDFNENRTIKGTGINFKIGIIYRISKIFRMGFAIHTPTAYRLVDSYNSGLYGRIVYDSLLRESNYPMVDQEPEVLQHDLATPWVFSGSFGAVIAKRGFINVDVEFTDYSWANFSLLDNERTPSNNQFINQFNRDVQGQYKGTLKARIGGEVAVGIARIRLGYQFQTSPYVHEVSGVTDFRHDISAGFGFRWKHFFLDFAYRHTLMDFAYTPYRHASLVQNVTGLSQTGHAMITVGASIFRDPNRVSN